MIKALILTFAVILMVVVLVAIIWVVIRWIRNEIIEDREGLRRETEEFRDIYDKLKDKVTNA